MELHFKVKQDLETAYKYLTDMDKFTSIHPIISKIESKGTNRYKVYETLKFGFIPFPFTYLVKIEEDKLNNKITMNAIVFKMIRIELKFRLHQEKQYTHIYEQIKFKTLFPIKFILEKVFRKQHQLLFKTLDGLSKV